MAINWNVSGGTNSWTGNTNWIIPGNGAKIYPNAGNLTAFLTNTLGSDQQITLNTTINLGSLNNISPGSFAHYFQTSNSSKFIFTHSYQSELNLKPSPNWNVGI
jgi:hypothetical protein